VHRLPVSQTKAERARDNKNDIDKAKRVPDKQKRLRKFSAHGANHSQRQDGNNDLATTRRSCKSAPQLAALPQSIASQEGPSF